jgi:hypothetical protein
LRIASTTCGGFALPLNEAAIFARRSGLDCVGAAACLARSRTGDSRSLSSRRKAVNSAA